jgi:hypothetical protein
MPKETLKMAMKLKTAAAEVVKWQAEQAEAQERCCENLAAALRVQLLPHYESQMSSFQCQEPRSRRTYCHYCYCHYYDFYLLPGDDSLIGCPV